MPTSQEQKKLFGGKWYICRFYSFQCSTETSRRIGYFRKGQSSTHCPPAKSGKGYLVENGIYVGFIPSSVRQRPQDELVTLGKDSPQRHAHQPRAEKVIWWKMVYMSVLFLPVFDRDLRTKWLLLERTVLNAMPTNQERKKLFGGKWYICRFYSFQCSTETSRRIGYFRKGQSSTPCPPAKSGKSYLVENGIR